MTSMLKNYKEIHKVIIRHEFVLEIYEINNVALK